nr:hypothetical protein [Eubacterium sp.]
MPFILFILLAILLLCPEIATEGSKNGLILWGTILVPSLLPFSVLTSLLRTRVQGTPYKYLLLLAGILSGYPIGAKISGELYLDGSLSRRQATFFAGFTNNPSPMFILFFIADNLLSLENERYLFFFLVLLSSFLGSFLFVLCFLQKEKKKASLPTHSMSIIQQKNLLQQMDIEITNSALLLLKIGGYIMLFSIITALFQAIPHLPESLQLLFCSLLEITTGTTNLALYGFSETTKITLSLAATTFGGLSAAAQTNGVLQKTGLSILHYIAIKVLSSIFALLLGVLFF